MTFKPKVWFPIAVVLTVIDLVAVWPAAAAGEAMHATTHALLAVAFGVWALRLRLGTGARGLEDELDQLELEANDLRQALAEAQERADFAERVLAQGAEQKRPEERR
jgi:hypothetical protein